jgi:hypothetical protein
VGAQSEVPRSTETDGSLYIIKQRAGYGSHGNTIVAGKKNALQRAKSVCSDDFGRPHPEVVLVQKMVDPPLLLRGDRKFSLRVYVVLFSNGGDEPPDVYISDQGLVKLAAASLEDLPNDDALLRRMHMTNSGRESGMQQKTLDYLRQELSLPSTGVPLSSWDDLWDGIVDATRTILRTYHRHALSLSRGDPELSSCRQTLAALGLPKILGLDFVVGGASSCLQSWLVEVNRFPGLEPRDEAQDAAVKQRVVRDAWSVAVSRAGENLADKMCLQWLHSDLEAFSNHLPHTSSLKKIDIRDT